MKSQSKVNLFLQQISFLQEQCFVLCVEMGVTVLCISIFQTMIFQTKKCIRQDTYFTVGWQPCQTKFKTNQ